MKLLSPNDRETCITHKHVCKTKKNKCKLFQTCQLLWSNGHIQNCINIISGNQDAREKEVKKHESSMLPISNFPYVTTKRIHFMNELGLCRRTNCWITRLHQNSRSVRNWSCFRIKPHIMTHVFNQLQTQILLLQ